VSDAEARAKTAIVGAGFESVDYFEARTSGDLERLGPEAISGGGRLLAAARIGRTRLIDNWPL
jgi:pantoate--beta-alanine ligase